MQYVDERPLDPLTLRIWPGTGEWTLYEDDHTFEYRTGAWATTTYRVRADGQQVNVEIQSRDRNGHHHRVKSLCSLPRRRTTLPRRWHGTPL